MPIRYMITLLLLTLSFNAIALDACFTGAWYDEERVGEGINLEAHEKFTSGFFYGFDKNTKPIWYAMLGDEILTMSVAIVVEDKTFITKEEDVGVAQVVPLADGVIRFRYTLIAEVDEDGDLKLCKGDHCTGDYIYTQLTRPIPCDEASVD